MKAKRERVRLRVINLHYIGAYICRLDSGSFTLHLFISFSLVGLQPPTVYFLTAINY